uniref:Late expression factor-3 n=1 Tax=Lymantria dispar multicapsid nuclear polyhedrosis virus TaxID=10449 RepID=A0A1B1MR23_NPVLD|nr:late expression factor-3 [Lymantria dispar multiple nucleopolyhedrovirus]
MSSIQEHNENKRKCDDDNDSNSSSSSSFKKLMKRMSSSGAGDNNKSDPEAGTYKILKSVTGELIAKNKININNESFFLFKFMVNDESKNFYGDSNCFYKMSLNNVYDVQLIYKNRKVYIKDCNINSSAENNCLPKPKRFLTSKNFDDNENVSVLAYSVCGFKMMNGDSFKMIFQVNLNRNDDFAPDDSCHNVQIECTASFSKLCNTIKSSKPIATESDLLTWFHRCQNKIVALHRIKCQKTNNNYRSLSIHNLTQIELLENEPTDEFNSPASAVNVSRSNKMVACSSVSAINVTHAPLSKCDRYLIKYKLPESGDEWINASFFNDNVFGGKDNGRGGNDGKDTSQKSNKLETDLNQLNLMLDNDLASVYIYVLYDLEKKTYNVLGITKQEKDSDVFESV